MIVHHRSTESPGTPPPTKDDFEVCDVVIEGMPGWTQTRNFRVDPDDDTKVRFEYSDGTPVRVRRASIIATRGRRPSSPPEELNRAALDRLTASGGEAGAATWTTMRADTLDEDSTIPRAGAQPAPLEASEEPF